MDLINMSCKSSQTVEKLPEDIINKYLKDSLTQWSYNAGKDVIIRKFEFKNFKQTMFFVNAVAYVCEKEVHHPDMRVGFNYCEIEFSTHDVGGVSLNDIICAGKIDKL